jgi:hypothetical protein
MIRLIENWYGMESGADSHWRWAESPAKLDITSDRYQEACLEITPTFIHDPEFESNFGDQGQLSIEDDSGLMETVLIRPGVTVDIPLSLHEGGNGFTLSLEAGNFQPGSISGGDARWLSFAIEQINLRTDTTCGT